MKDQETLWCEGEEAHLHIAPTAFPLLPVGELRNLTRLDYGGGAR